jgi:hypothetical protein
MVTLSPRTTEAIAAKVPFELLIDTDKRLLLKRKATQARQSIGETLLLNYCSAWTIFENCGTLLSQRRQSTAAKSLDFSRQNGAPSAWVRDKSAVVRE